MADSGRPLPWSLRERIQAMIRAGSSRRAVARELGLAKRTVDKYSRTVAQQQFQSSPSST